MIELDVSKDNMAGVVMGKNVYLPWRGQRNVCLNVSFNEWLSFIREYGSILTDRTPVNYQKALNGGQMLTYRMYMFDVSWALYNEVMISANESCDATLIVPYFGEEYKSVSLQECVDRARALSSDLSMKCARRLSIAQPCVLSSPTERFSDWNYQLFLLSLYLHSFAYSKTMEKFNIMEVG